MNASKTLIHAETQKFPGTLRMKQHENFFSKNLSLNKQQEQDRESMANDCPSFRVYYGGVSVAVPFVWESKPGTPKHPSFTTESSDLLPPLTPPPSYHQRQSNIKPSMQMKGRPRALVIPDFYKKLPKIISIHGSRSKALGNTDSSSSLSPMEKIFRRCGLPCRTAKTRPLAGYLLDDGEHDD